MRYLLLTYRYYNVNLRELGETAWGGAETAGSTGLLAKTNVLDQRR